MEGPMKNATEARCWTLVVTLALSVAALAHPARRYQLVNLDAVVGVPGVAPVAINDAGIVAIRAFQDGRVVSLLYDSKSGQVVQVFPVEDGFINAISNNGNTAGTGSFGVNGWFVVDGVSGTVPFFGGTGSGALAINERGEVAGFINLVSGFFGASHAIIYST